MRNGTVFRLRRQPDADRIAPRDLRRLRRWMTDRRGGERADVRAANVTAVVRRVGPGLGDAGHAGVVRDVSGEGLSMLLPAAFGRGEKLEVTLTPARGRGEIRLLCVVRWSRPDPAAGGHAVGCGVGIGWCDSLLDLLIPPSGREAA